MIVHQIVATTGRLAEDTFGVWRVAGRRSDSRESPAKSRMDWLGISDGNDKRNEFRDFQHPPCHLLINAPFGGRKTPEQGPKAFRNLQQIPETYEEAMSLWPCDSGRAY